MLVRSKPSKDFQFKNEFIDIILNLNLKNINERTYVNVAGDIGIFHEKFKPLLLAEIKSNIKNSFYEAKNNLSQFSDFKITSRIDEQNFLVIDQMNSQTFNKQSDLFVINMGRNDFILAKLHQYQNKSGLKISNNNFYYFRNDLLPNKYLKVFALTSILPHARMYAACSIKVEAPFANELYEKIPSIKISRQEDDKFINKYGLNQKQEQIITEFSELKTGIRLGWGPPGTGKTQMISRLIKVLADKNERILICAQANQAIHTLAERFTQEYPNIKTLVLSSEGNQLESLNKYSLKNLSKSLPPTISEIFTNLIKKIEDDNSYLKRSEKHTEFREEAKQISERLQNKNDVGLRDRILIMVEKLLESIVNSINNPISERKYNNLMEESKNISQALLAHENKNSLILNSVQVIFSTLSFIGKDIYKKLTTDTLIIDEAGKALEPETLIPFHFNPKKCLLIGDHKQLKPYTTLSNQVYEYSMFQRLIETNKNSYYTLVEQYRMHPEIQSWISKKYYENQLICRKNLHTNNLPRVLEPISFINIPSREMMENTSYHNIRESQYAAYIVRFLQSKKMNKTIGIITFYESQVKTILKDLAQLGIKNISVKTIDSYQGAEKDFIIVSFVRASKTLEVGFIADPNRLNVALSRASDSLIMLGDLETLDMTNKDIKDLVHDMKNRNLMFSEQDLITGIAMSSADQNAITPYTSLSNNIEKNKTHSNYYNTQDKKLYQNNNSHNFFHKNTHKRDENSYVLKNDRHYEKKQKLEHRQNSNMRFNSSHYHY